MGAFHRVSKKIGFPHEHFLLIMDNNSKLSGPDDYDKYISIELLDEKKYPILHRLVRKHVMHGPCGIHNSKCACKIDGNCRFKYPRQFCEQTQQGKDDYPIYIRCRDAHKVFIRKKWMGKRWVVPYYPTLLMCCKIVRSMGKDIRNYGLPHLDESGSF